MVAVCDRRPVRRSLDERGNIERRTPSHAAKRQTKSGYIIGGLAGCVMPEDRAPNILGKSAKSLNLKNGLRDRAFPSRVIQGFWKDRSGSQLINDR